MSTGIQTCQTKHCGKWLLENPNRAWPHELERNLPSRGWGRARLTALPFRYLSKWANPLLYQVFAQILSLPLGVPPWQPSLNCELLLDLHWYAVLCSVAKSCWLFETLWAVALQAPLSMGFFMQEHWSGLPLPSAGDLPFSRIDPHLLCLLHCRQILYQWATREAPANTQ